MTTFVAYVLTFKRLKSLEQNFIDGMGIKPHKLFWYPGVLFIVFVPRLLDGLAKTFYKDQEFFFLKAMHMILTHSIGMANAIVYGFQMKSYYRKYEEADSFRSRMESFLNESLEVPDFDTTRMTSK